jgi:flagellar biogenesis protein FliO
MNKNLAFILGSLIAALALLSMVAWLGWDLFLLANPD